MKNKFLLGIAALLSFWLVLAGCQNPGNPTEPSPGNPTEPGPGDLETPPGTNLTSGSFSGTFNGLKFVVNKTTSSSNSYRSARVAAVASIASSESPRLRGYLQDGDKRYELNGFLDTENGNFILTGASADAVFTINGANDLDGKPMGRGYNAKKSGSSWDDGKSNSVVFDSAVSVTQSSTVQNVSGLPEKWWGKWDNSGAINAQTVEGFGTSHSDKKGMYCLVVSSFGLATWLDTDMDFENEMATQKEGYPDKSDEQKQKDAIKQVGSNIISCVRDFNVYEVEKKSDDEYHVLASLIKTSVREEENGDRFTVFEDPYYVRIRFKTHGNGLTATIASADDGYGNNQTKFESIEEARSANTFASDNESDYAGDKVMDNKTVLFLTRF